MLTQKVAFLLLFYVTFVNGTCQSKETCQQCIQTIGCVWCTELLSTKDYEGVPIQCRPHNASNWCKPNQLIDPKMTFSKIQDKELSEQDGNTIQMKPQRVKLSLRKGQKRNIQFKFKNAANYPVDLYYIMDLSKSMEAYKQSLAKLGKTLSETMRNITNNFRIGFGSFIDKVELPFTSTYPKSLQSPCSLDNGGHCASPYSFKNMLPLSPDDDKFVKEVTEARLSGNLDSPEGGFDAIMQAMVCKKEINWRDQARHLIIFSTDAQFHIAGDGKLAGVIEPNPAKCYKNDSEYLIYDYPSVSQISYVAKENSISIIFAVPRKVGKAYKLLSNSIENSKFGELDENNSIVKLIVENYQKIVGSVKFKSNATEDVDIQFSSNCNSNGLTDRCSNVHVGELVEFNATINLINCPQDGQKTKHIAIKPEGLAESLIIELELQCDCPCSAKDDPTFQPKSSRCSGVGDLTCGICSCPNERFGRNCECDVLQSKSQNATNCIKEGTSEICSGSGVCKCGKCECDVIPNNLNEKFSGQFCECDNFSCKREGGLLCSNRGKCNCKKCECIKGFTGDACECETSKSNCMAPNSDEICSNHGNCECNRCQCEITNNNRYSGKYCEDCTSCPAQRCEELRPCVQCQAYKTGIYKDTCETQCTAFRTLVVEKLDSDENEEIKKCRIPDNDTCIINFDYHYKEGNALIVRALNKKICPEPPNILAWILGVVASILLAGLIMLLMWKIFTSIHDRREYAKFENERAKLKWGAGDNPLYKGATSTFANPAYNRNSVNYGKKKLIFQRGV